MDQGLNKQNKRKRVASSAGDEGQKKATRSNPPRSAAMKGSAAATYDDSDTDSKLEKTNKTKKPRKKRATRSKKPFRFLDLPAELRNNIYELVLNDSSVTLRRYARRRKTTTVDNEAPNWQDSIVVASPLIQVNKQVSAEFLHAAAIFANIQATVRDFDFGYIITFLNRLSDGMLNKMKVGEEDQAPKRLFNITLVHICYDEDSGSRLRPWLNRMEVPAKKGTNIDFRYAIGPFPPPPTWPHQARVNHPQSVISRVSSNYASGGRAAVEWTKIHSAAQKARH